LQNVSDTELIQQYTVRRGKIMKKGANPETVVVISDYGINCGIATYTKYLCDALRPLVSDLIILAEHAAGLPEEPGVIRCWDRKSSDYSRLCAEVEKINPDLIIIQHEFGLFHKLNAWNTLMSQLSRWRTVVTFHTVLEHDVPNEVARLDYMTRSLAEAACREIIVHTPRARKTLRARGFSGRVHFIPHGCFAPDRSPRLPSTKYGMYPPHSIFQYGFGGTHKGWEFAIETVERLVKQYHEVIYVGIFNVPISGSNTVYYRSLLDMVKSKGLDNNVAIHRGYQSEDMLKNFIRSSRVALFPYQVPNANWASWGASGAVQLPISMGLPIIMTHYPAFMEFKGRLPLVNTPDEAAAVIDRIFSDKEYEKQVSDQAFAIAEERRWDKVAKWYLGATADKDFNAPVVSCE
jgi:glycosyltransferase involved in cell wall biosynthesis